MSANKQGLSHPAVIGVVVVGLAVVIVMNVRTFTSKRAPRSSPSALEAMVATEGSNALAFLSSAIESGTLAFADTSVSAAEFHWPRNMRDPFQPITVHAGRTRKSTRSQAAGRNLSSMRCNAVLLQGDDLMAVIGGETYRIGDLVGGAALIRIDTGGVVLSDAQGTTRLDVTPESTADGEFTIVRHEPTPRRQKSEQVESHPESGGGQ